MSLLPMSSGAVAGADVLQCQDHGEIRHAPLPGQEAAVFRPSSTLRAHPKTPYDTEIYCRKR